MPTRKKNEIKLIVAAEMDFSACVGRQYDLSPS
jgi:hypothetical protein